MTSYRTAAAAYPQPMQIAIPIFPKLTALDAVGPYEVLQRLPGSDLVFIGHELGNTGRRITSWG
jgi:hypothetical protein